MTRDELADGDAAGRCPGARRITDHIDAALLAQAGDRLKLIANYGAGVDHIDVATARQRGILVSNTPGRGDRRYRRHDHGADPGRDPAHPRGAGRDAGGRLGGLGADGLLGGRVGGKRLGILGMGRIGQAVARRARAFGMQVHYHNRKRLRPEVEEELRGDLLGKPRPDGEPDGHDLASTARTRRRPST